MATERDNKNNVHRRRINGYCKSLLHWHGKLNYYLYCSYCRDIAAFATVALAFISLLGWTYSYSICFARFIGTAGRTTLHLPCALVDWLNGDWGTFFICTSIMVIPSLVCLWLIRKKIRIGTS